MADGRMCLQQRHEIFARAEKISDPLERARLLESMPVCSDETPPTTPKLIAMLATLGVGGCSFIGVRGPPSPLPVHGMVTCKDTETSPVSESRSLQN
jgi:hypothetical protein